MKHLKNFLITILTISIVISSVFCSANVFVDADTTKNTYEAAEVQTVDLKAAELWNFGKAWDKDGLTFSYNSYRIGLVKEVAVEAGDVLVFNTNNKEYKFIVSAINTKSNSQVKYIGSVDNGEEVAIPDGCDAVRLSLYNAVNEKSASVLINYMSVASGVIKPIITIRHKANKAEAPSIEEPVVTNTPVPTATYTPKPTATSTPKPTATSTPKPTATSTPKPMATSTPKPTATSTPKPTATSTPKPTATPIPTQAAFDYSKCNTLTEVYVAMLENAEENPVDISRFHVTSTMNSKAWNEAINGKGCIAYESREVYLFTKTTKKGLYLTTTKIEGFDDNFLTRYNDMKKAVADAMALVKNDMTDLDKALVLHDFLMDKGTYVSEADGAHSTWGILAYGKGVCMSYSLAYGLLLKQVGIDYRQIVSEDMNHMWTAVKLDGSWYQVDSTWDDTLASKYGKHYFFLRSDNQFQNVLTKKHYNYRTWEQNILTVHCTSSRFDNWFVHDIKGKMVYSDTFWYYADGNKLMKAHLDGSDMQVVVEANSAVTLSKLSDGYVYYKVDGVTLKVAVK